MPHYISESAVDRDHNRSRLASLRFAAGPPVRFRATSTLFKALEDKALEEMAMRGDKNFDRSTLEHALAELGQRAFAAGRTVEIVIYGGSEKFYPQNVLQPKTRLGLEEIFSSLDIDRGNDPGTPSSSLP